MLPCTTYSIASSKTPYLSLKDSNLISKAELLLMFLGTFSSQLITIKDAHSTDGASIVQHHEHRKGVQYPHVATFGFLRAPERVISINFSYDLDITNA